MTPRQARKKYIRIVGIRGNWDVWLAVKCQSFTISTGGGKYKRRAQWFARMLSIALARMINNETK